MTGSGGSDDRELIEQLRCSLGKDERADAPSRPVSADTADEEPPAPTRSRVVAPAAIAIADQIMGLEAAIFESTQPGLSIQGPKGASVALTDEVVIGRQDGERRLVVADGRVSRSHVRLVRASGSVTAEDLGSSNGTTVVRNGEVIVVNEEPVELQVGDRLETIDGLVLATVIEHEAEAT